MRRDIVVFAAAMLGIQLCALCDGQKEAAAAPKAEQAAAQVQKAAEKEEEFDLLEAIGLLRPGSVVLEVGDKKLAWRDVRPMVSPILKANQKEGDRSTTEKRIHAVFQAIASRGLLLSEAEAMNVTVTDEDRKDFEADLERNLEGNDRGMTKEKFIASFNKNGSTMARLSFDDALKLMKLDRMKFGGIDISDNELQVYIRYRKAMNKVIAQKNAETRKAMESLLKEPGIDDDNGFMKLARLYSEGTESENGGILNYDFTREDLAEINDLKAFEWKVGETTPLFETATDFRIMRILSALPKKDGEPEKFRVAQILHGKVALMDNDDHAALKAEMLTKKKKKAIDDFVVELQGKYKVSSRLFPDGLWPKGEDAQARPSRQAENIDLRNVGKNGGKLRQKTAGNAENTSEKAAEEEKEGKKIEK